MLLSGGSFRQICITKAAQAQTPLFVLSGASDVCLRQQGSSRRCYSDEEKVVDEATAVIIGGGAVGSSVAYHLAKRGLKNVVLMDRGQIGASGATCHPVGFVNYTHGVSRYKRIQAYSVDLYSKLTEETGHDVEFATPGTIRLATSSKRDQEFKRYISTDRYDDFVGKTKLIAPEEVRKMCPLLLVDKVLSALYSPGDGYINPAALAKALSIGAKNNGALVYEGLKMNNLRKNNSIWEVETDRGIIKARTVINTTGLWARDNSLKVGLDLPLVLLEHQYAFTGPVAALKAEGSHFMDLPAIYDHEDGFYLRVDRAGKRFMIGAFEHMDEVTVRDWSTLGVPEDVKQSSIEPNFDRVKQQYKAACSLVPSLKQSGLVEKHAGVFCMTPDCLPLVGPAQNLPNYWMAVGFFDGVSSAGGIGKYLSDWIMDREPPFELYETDANRFGNWADKKFTIARAKESYSMFYNWSYYDAERLAGRPARVSGLYGALKSEGAQMQFRAGWEVPVYFEVSGESDLNSRARNYQIVTNKCGLIDLAYKGKIEIRGPDASPFLEYLCTTKTPGLNCMSETLMLSPKGKIMSRLNVIHHDQHKSEFLLVGDPEHEHRDMKWLEFVARDKGFNVDIHNVSAFLSAIGIVGPLSQEVLSELTLADLSENVFPFGTTRLLRLAGVPVIAAKTSETGELGWELYHNRADSLKLYAALQKAGEKYGITNFGTMILNTLRIEKGEKRFGKEICMDTNPYEANIESLVDADKPDFIGKGSLNELKTKELSRRLALVALEDDSSEEDSTVPWGSVRGMEVIRKEGSDEIIGQITSGCYSFVLQRPLCFAWLKKEITESDKLSVDLGTWKLPAHILSEPPSTLERLRAGV